MEALAAELLDQLTHQDQPADLNTTLALPLPILVICELLGVPYEDRVRFRTWTQAAADILDRQRSEQGLGELFQSLQRRSPSRVTMSMVTHSTRA